MNRFRITEVKPIIRAISRQRNPYTLAKDEQRRRFSCEKSQYVSTRLAMRSIYLKNTVNTLKRPPKVGQDNVAKAYI